MFKVCYRILYSDDKTGIGSWYVEDTLNWQKIVRGKFTEKLKIMECDLREIFIDFYSVSYCGAVVGFVKITHVKKEGD